MKSNVRRPRADPAPAAQPLAECSALRGYSPSSQFREQPFLGWSATASFRPAAMSAPDGGFGTPTRSRHGRRPYPPIGASVGVFHGVQRSDPWKSRAHLGPTRIFRLSNIVAIGNLLNSEEILVGAKGFE